MAIFFYKARGISQDLIEGRIEAANLDEAVARVLRLGLSPFDIKEDVSIPTGSRRGIFYKIPRGEVMHFIRHMSDLMEAGVPLSSALQMTKDQTKVLPFKNILAKIQESVEDGTGFSEALRAYPEVFSPVSVHLINSGELSGKLPGVLKRLAEFSEKNNEVQTRITASLVYPVLILVVGAATVFILLTFVIPRLTVMFDEFEETLPGITRLLIAVSNFFSHFGWLIIAAAGFLFWYVRRLKLSPDGRLRLDQWKMKIPFAGDFIRATELGCVMHSLATLLESGIVIDNALKAVLDVPASEVLKGELKEVLREVINGGSLTEAIQRARYLSESAVAMIAVSEQSGDLPKGLQKLAAFYERRADQMIKVTVSLLEPVMILVMGAIVGFIVIASLLPIFRMDMMVRY